MRIRWKVSAWPLHLSRGNRRLIAPYILLFNLLLIISDLGGSVMRGASAFIMADHLNRFSNGSPSLICVARDWHVLWPDLGLALASLYPDSARDPAGDLWRYLVTLKISRSASSLCNTLKYHRLKSRRSPVNFSGSGRAFYFRGGLWGSRGSAKPSSSTCIAGFGDGFRIIAGILCIYSRALIFRD